MVVLFSGCKAETHISSVIIDEQTGLPVQGVLVRTVKELNGTTLAFAGTRSSSDGSFDLRFNTKIDRSPKVMVELSKAGYLTNMYSCYHEKKGDTLILARE